MNRRIVLQRRRRVVFRMVIDTYLDNATQARCTMTQLNAVLGLTQENFR